MQFLESLRLSQTKGHLADPHWVTEGDLAGHLTTLTSPSGAAKGCLDHGYTGSVHEPSLY